MATEMKKRASQNKAQSVESVKTTETVEVKEPEKKEPRKYTNDEGIVLYSDKSSKYYMEILKQNYENLKYEIIENCRHNFKNNEQELA